MNGARVFAVVVAYNPDEGFAARIGTYLSQVERVLVVDNSTDPEPQARVRALPSALGSTVEVLGGGGNHGLARAQNIGIAAALAGGAEWVLLFDDDSEAAPDMVAQLLTVLGRHPHPERIGLLAPLVIDRGTGAAGAFITGGGLSVWRKRAEGLPWLDGVLTAIASGSLVRAQALRQCGPMREHYFVDSIDIDYCLRLRSVGWQIVAVSGARLMHSLGRKTRHGVEKLHFVTSNHAAWRRYTMTRNRVDVWKRYFLRFPAYVAYDKLVFYFETLKMLCFEGERLPKLRALARGLRDGMLGRFPRN